MKLFISVMIIIDKYFKSNNNYINIMKVNKKYHYLIEMYHFNPINDIYLLILKYNIYIIRIIKK